MREALVASKPPHTQPRLALWKNKSSPREANDVSHNIAHIGFAPRRETHRSSVDHEVIRRRARSEHCPLDPIAPYRSSGPLSE